MNDNEFEIEYSLDNKEKTIVSIKPELTNFIFPNLDNYETDIISNYIEHIPAEERAEITHNTTKKYTDSAYEGDIYKEQRHGLGKMNYESGRYYFGE